jgi:hypothetical protein
MASFVRRLFGGGKKPKPAPAAAPKPKPQPVGGVNQAGSRGSNRPKGKTTYTSSLGLTPEQRSGITLKSLTGA